MRIISKFRDFYDSGMSQGIDTTKVFVRQTEFVNYIFPLKYRATYGKDRSGIPSIAIYKGPFNDIYLTSFIVLFAGKIYPGIEVSSGVLDAPQQFYSVKPLITYLEKHDLQSFLLDHRGKPDENHITDIKDLFNLQGSEILTEFAIEHKISIAVDRSMTTSRRTSANGITLNPKLSDLGFQKLFDPFTAYQELEMWIGGVLTEPDPPSPMTDPQRVISHGFDLKTSFRKGKESQQESK